GSVSRLEEMRDDRLRIIRQPNAGKSVAMNHALAEMRGEYYAIQDADDISHPTRIERQLGRILREPELAGVFCGHELLIGGKRCARRFREKEKAECRSDIEAFRMPAHDPTGMFRWKLVEGIEYAPELRIGQGFDYILRVGEKY